MVQHYFLPPLAAQVRLLLLFLCLAVCQPASAQVWQSARAIAAATVSPGNYSVVTATTVDAAGNVFLAGTFTNSVVLGSTTLTSVGDRDVFVAKFDPVANQFVWAQRAGGMGRDEATALAVNGTSVYVAGYFFSATAGFGPTILTNARSGTSDAFVAKLTASTGGFAWAQPASGMGNEQATALAAGGTSVYVTGHFSSSTMSFGQMVLVNSSASNSDIFVAKLTDAGPSSSWTWAQLAGGIEGNFAFTLAVEGASVYIAGDFRGPTANFGLTTLTNSSAGTSDVFVAKLTDAGSTSSWAWAQRAGGTNNDYAQALAVSGPNVYVTGFFNSPTAGFGATALTNGGMFDVYVAKLTDAGPTGGFTWAQRAGGTGLDQALALAVSGTSVYIAGAFASSTASFGSTALTNVGGVMNEVYVAKLTDTGRAATFTWAQRAGGTSSDVANVLVLSGGIVYVAGYSFSPLADFGTVFLPNPDSSTQQGFLAALTDATPTATVTSWSQGPGVLFPNPARHMATLRLPAGALPVPLVLTNALGRVVRHYPAPAAPSTVLDLRGLPAGLYLLHGTGPAQRLAVE
jgi:hypothetical protein